MPIDPEAERRLQVLEHHTELGAGYRIALKDLELRGAGNLLGAEQSGFVHAVGFDMYLRMLDETVQRLMRGDAAPKLAAGRRLDGHRRPTCPTTTSRRRKPSSTSTGGWRASTTPAEIEALRAELRDRFGPLPAPAEAMLRDGAAADRSAARSGIEGILVRGDEARITFRDTRCPG